MKLLNLWLNMKSRMKGDFHVRFCENAGVKFPCVTRLIKINDCKFENSSTQNKSCKGTATYHTCKKLDCLKTIKKQLF